MKRIRPVFAVLASAALYMSIPACSVGTDELTTASESDLGTVGPASVVGSIVPGTSSAPIRYSATPKYRALSFTASVGDRLEAWVRSTDGDAVAWITDATFKSLATNDDASSDTHDAHVVATIEKTGLQYLVFRERDFEPAVFTASLARAADSAPTPGTSCTTENEIARQACGFCGQKAIVCLRDDNGTKTWSEYGPCEGEHGTCAAGSTRVAACNNCGTHAETCTAACEWNTSATCSEPAGAGCSPGSFDITTAGCALPFTYRVRTCSATCAYELFSASCGPAPTTIEVGATRGSTSSTVAVLTGSLPVLSTNLCPAATFSTVASAYAYTQIHNPTGSDVTVTLAHSLAPGATAVESALAIYASPTAPTTDAERKACVSATSSSKARVTIPAGATYIVYNTAKRATTDAQAVRLTATTE
jgi:hypothetical protein